MILLGLYKHFVTFVLEGISIWKPGQDKLKEQLLFTLILACFVVTMEYSW
jgi:hypothetical protein